MDTDSFKKASIYRSDASKSATAAIPPADPFWRAVFSVSASTITDTEFFEVFTIEDARQICESEPENVKTMMEKSVGRIEKSLGKTLSKYSRNANQARHQSAGGRLVKRETDARTGIQQEVQPNVGVKRKIKHEIKQEPDAEQDRMDVDSSDESWDDPQGQDSSDEEFDPELNRHLVGSPLPIIDANNGYEDKETVETERRKKYRDYDAAENSDPSLEDVIKSIPKPDPRGLRYPSSFRPIHTPVPPPRTLEARHELMRTSVEAEQALPPDSRSTSVTLQAPPPGRRNPQTVSTTNTVTTLNTSNNANTLERTRTTTQSPLSPPPSPSLPPPPPSSQPPELDPISGIRSTLAIIRQRYSRGSSTDPNVTPTNFSAPNRHMTNAQMMMNSPEFRAEVERVANERASIIEGFRNLERRARLLLQAFPPQPIPPPQAPGQPSNYDYSYSTFWQNATRAHETLRNAVNEDIERERREEQAHQDANAGRTPNSANSANGANSTYGAYGANGAYGAYSAYGIANGAANVANGIANGSANSINGAPNGVANGVPNGVAHGIQNGVAHGIPNGAVNGAASARNGIVRGVANGVTNGAATRVPNGIANGAASGIRNGVTNVGNHAAHNASNAQSNAAQNGTALNNAAQNGTALNNAAQNGTAQSNATHSSMNGASVSATNTNADRNTDPTNIRDRTAARDPSMRQVLRNSANLPMPRAPTNHAVQRPGGIVSAHRISATRPLNVTVPSNPVSATGRPRMSRASVYSMSNREAPPAPTTPMTPSVPSPHNVSPSPNIPPSPTPNIPPLQSANIPPLQSANIPPSQSTNIPPLRTPNIPPLQSRNIPMSSIPSPLTVPSRASVREPPYNPSRSGPAFPSSESRPRSAANPPSIADFALSPSPSLENSRYLHERNWIRSAAAIEELSDRYNRAESESSLQMDDADENAELDEPMQFPATTMSAAAVKELEYSTTRTERRSRICHVARPRQCMRYSRTPDLIRDSREKEFAKHADLIDSPDYVPESSKFQHARANAIHSSFCHTGKRKYFLDATVGRDPRSLLMSHALRILTRLMPIVYEGSEQSAVLREIANNKEFMTRLTTVLRDLMMVPGFTIPPNTGDFSKDRLYYSTMNTPSHWFAQKLNPCDKDDPYRYMLPRCQVLKAVLSTSSARMYKPETCREQDSYHALKAWTENADITTFMSLLVTGVSKYGSIDPQMKQSAYSSLETSLISLAFHPVPETAPTTVQRFYGRPQFSEIERQAGIASPRDPRRDNSFSQMFKDLSNPDDLTWMRSRITDSLSKHPRDSLVVALAWEAHKANSNFCDVDVFEMPWTRSLFPGNVRTTAKSPLCSSQSLTTMPAQASAVGREIFNRFIRILSRVAMQVVKLSNEIDRRNNAPKEQDIDMMDDHYTKLAEELDREPAVRNVCNFYRGPQVPVPATHQQLCDVAEFRYQSIPAHIRAHLEYTDRQIRLWSQQDRFAPRPSMPQQPRQRDSAFMRTRPEGRTPTEQTPTPQTSMPNSAPTSTQTSSTRMPASTPISARNAAQTATGVPMSTPTSTPTSTSTSATTSSTRMSTLRPTSMPTGMPTSMPTPTTTSYSSSGTPSSPTSTSSATPAGIPRVPSTGMPTPTSATPRSTSSFPQMQSSTSSTGMPRPAQTSTSSTTSARPTTSASMSSSEPAFNLPAAVLRGIPATAARLRASAGRSYIQFSPDPMMRAVPRRFTEPTVNPSEPRRVDIEPPITQYQENEIMDIEKVLAVVGHRVTGVLNFESSVLLDSSWNCTPSLTLNVGESREFNSMSNSFDRLEMHGIYVLEEIAESMRRIAWKAGERNKNLRVRGNVNFDRPIVGGNWSMCEFKWDAKKMTWYEQISWSLVYNTDKSTYEGTEIKLFNEPVAEGKCRDPTLVAFEEA